MTPKRIQRKREKGWRLAEHTTNPDGAVCVTRPGKWGNPFKAGMDSFACEQAAKVGGVAINLEDAPNTRQEAVELYRWWMGVQVVLDPRELRGKDLACFCPLDRPCHADVLLAIANAPERDGAK